jgi:hypothetical protein
MKANVLAAALIGAGCVGLSSFDARAELAESSAEQLAVQAFTRGRQQYDAAQFEEALASFREALERASSPNARLYVGRSLRRLGRLAEAYNELRRAAQEADNRARTEPRYATTRESAREEANALVGSVAFVTLTVINAPSGAVVTIDGQRTGPALWGTPLARTPGSAHVEARADGMQPVTLNVELRAGSDTRVRIPFAAVSTENLQGAVQIGFGDPAAPASAQGVETVDVDRSALDASMGSRVMPAATTQPTTAARGASSAWVPVGGVAVAIGLGGVINGIVFAAFAEDRFQSLRRLCGVGSDCRNDPSAQAQIAEGRQFDTISVASAVAGGALAVAGVAMVIGGVLQNESLRAAERRAVAPMFVRVRPAIVPMRSGATLSIGGAF